MNERLFSNHPRKKLLALRIALAGAVAALALLACSSSSSSGPSATKDAGPATCAAPGAAVSGPADTHCMGKVQPVNAASCNPAPDAGGGGDMTSDAGAAEGGGADTDAGGGGETCPYGDTLPGQSGSDDDCKYTVSWTSTSICEGSVNFTVTVKTNAGGTPVTGIPMGVIIETFTSTPMPACDDQSMHPGPNTGASLTETTPGSGVYSGVVQLDASGLWTVRFHIHEECADLLEDSPHGHIAFHINVP